MRMLDTSSECVKQIARPMPSSATLFFGDMKTIRATRRERLGQLISEAGGQAALASRLGKDRNQVWQWTLPDDDRRGRGISDRMAREVERVMGRPAGWMDAATDAAPPAIVVHPIASLPDDVRPDGETEHEIETLEFELSAGSGKIVPTVIETRSPIVYRDSWFKKMRIKPERAKRVRVDGDSMESTLFDGDYAILNLDDTRIVDGRVYALIYGSDRFGRIKRLYRTAHGVRIVSDNVDKARFPDEIVEGHAFDELAVIGRVIDKSGRGGL